MKKALVVALGALLSSNAMSADKFEPDSRITVAVGHSQVKTDAAHFKAGGVAYELGYDVDENLTAKIRYSDTDFGYFSGGNYAKYRIKNIGLYGEIGPTFGLDNIYVKPYLSAGLEWSDFKAPDSTYITGRGDGIAVGFGFKVIVNKDYFFNAEYKFADVLVDNRDNNTKEAYAGVGYRF